MTLNNIETFRIFPVLDDSYRPRSCGAVWAAGHLPTYLTTGVTLIWRRTWKLIRNKVVEVAGNSHFVLIQ